jgi:HEAT repeat protein
MLLLWCLNALAAPAAALTQRERPETPEALIADLRDGRPPDQLFAVRELRRLTRISIAETNHRDPIRSMEARQFLIVFDDALAPTCTELLGSPRLTRSCADILGMLETGAALPALEAALPDARRATRRHIERAIRAIKEP